MAISKPLHLNRHRLNLILIAASVLVSLVYNLPRFFEFESRRIIDIQENNITAGKLFVIVIPDKRKLICFSPGNDTEEENHQLWQLVSTPLREVSRNPDFLALQYSRSTNSVLLVRPVLRFLVKALSHRAVSILLYQQPQYCHHLKVRLAMQISKYLSFYNLSLKSERVFSEPTKKPEGKSARGEHVKDPGPDRDSLHHLSEHQARP